MLPNLTKFLENKTALIFDIFFCAVLMPALILLGPARYWLTSWPVFFWLVCGFLYLCYFAIRIINVPRKIISKSYAPLVDLTAVLVGGTYMLSRYRLPDVDFVTPYMSAYQTRIRDHGVMLTLWLMFSLVAGYSLSVAFVCELYEQLLLKRQIESQRDKANLAMFKAQISPHFLFNTLNSLYSLVIGTSEKAEDAFIKFTDILKYTYSSIDKEWVTVEDEAGYISSYIDLQAIRLDSHTHVEWNYNADEPNALIPPMVLLTFVENAFKYGASTRSDCYISISLTLYDGQLTFTTRNRIVKRADEFRTEMPVGIENCRARLGALYPGRHTLDTTEADGEFFVTLNIQLQ